MPATREAQPWEFDDFESHRGMTAVGYKGNINAPTIKGADRCRVGPPRTWSDILFRAPLSISVTMALLGFVAAGLALYDIFSHNFKSALPQYSLKVLLFQLLHYGILLCLLAHKESHMNIFYMLCLVSQHY